MVPATRGKSSVRNSTSPAGSVELPAGPAGAARGCRARYFCASASNSAAGRVFSARGSPVKGGAAGPASERGTRKPRPIPGPLLRRDFVAFVASGKLLPLLLLLLLCCCHCVCPTSVPPRDRTPCMSFVFSTSGGLAGYVTAQGMCLCCLSR